MTKKLKLLFGFSLLLTVLSTIGMAQSLKTPAPSPLQTVKQNFALGEITIEYSRPGAKGRVIFGDVVPYGKMWRTGANASTKISFSDDVTIEDNLVPAGTYALYTLPGKDSWEIMLYKDLTLGGNLSDYKKENEQLRFTVKPSAYGQKIETFTIAIDDIKPTSCNIELIWEQTKIAFKVSTDIDSKIMKNIDVVMANDSRPYYTAANYYYENNKDLKKALEWVSKATEQNPKAYWVWHLKANIQLKLKDGKGAIESAEKSKALATESQDDAYIKKNDSVITAAKALK